jgi:mRNA interferase MazF
VGKITTVAKAKLGSRLRRPDDDGILRLNRAMLVFLGLAGLAPSAQASRGRDFESRHAGV